MGIPLLLYPTIPFPSIVFYSTPPPAWIMAAGLYAIPLPSTLRGHTPPRPSHSPGVTLHPFFSLNHPRPHNLPSLPQGRSPTMPSQHAHSQPSSSHLQALSHSQEAFLKHAKAQGHRQGPCSPWSWHSCWGDAQYQKEELKPHENKDCLLFWLLYAKCLDQCFAFNRHLINSEWIK